MILTTLDQHSDTDSLSSQLGEFGSETFAASRTDFFGFQFFRENMIQMLCSSC